MWSSPFARTPLAVVLGLAAALLAFAAGSAQAAAPRVEAMVVSKAGAVTGPRTVRVGALGSGGCRLRAGLPIGVLRALGVPFRAKGSCASLYVFEVRGEREQGTGGWVYKVGHRQPARSASDPAGRLRSGQRVLWYWCRLAGRCDRTLATAARASAGRIHVTVSSYDDAGRGQRVAGATVLVRRLGTSVRARFATGRDGTVAIPTTRGARYRIDSRRPGTIPGFWTEVRAR